MLFRFIPLVLLLSGLAACTPRFDNSSAATPTSSVQTASSTSTTSATPTVRPTTKSDTIRVEGETRQITLLRYESLRFTTDVPANYFVTDQVSSGEGSATWFYAKRPDGTANKDVYVQVFFPGSPTTLKQLRQQLLGDRGLFIINGWRVTGGQKGNLYPWATEKITFDQRTNDRNIVGAVFLGQSGGRTFYVIKHYPGDYGDGFEPLAGKILSSLEIRPQAQLERDSKLTLNGIGSVRIGMTVAEASLATGVPLNPLGQSAPGSSCRYVAPQGEPAGLNLMVIGNRIVRIDVVGNSRITTLSGAKIGDTEAHIKALYPGQIEVTPHKYLLDGHYLTFVPKDPQDRDNQLIFETDGDRVTQFRAGKLPEVAWVEGCS